MIDSMDWSREGGWSAMSANLQKLFEPLTSGSPFAPATKTEGSSGGVVPDSLAAINDLVRRTFDGWNAMALSEQPSKSAAMSEALAKLFDPADWSKAMSGGADAALNRLVNAPTFATLTDSDRKASVAQKLWLVHLANVQRYQAQINEAWMRASVSFTKSLGDAGAPKIDTARSAIDLWLSAANNALLEMHHRPEFLEAQRDMARSGAEYRLQEQKIAEVFCAANHIPTRTEVDELQEAVYHLRREVRSLKRQLEQKERPR